MIRSQLAVVLIAGLGVAAACPAAAQFGSIFGDPPRPPSNVPNRPAAPPPGPPPGLPPDVRRSPDVEPERLLPPGPPPSARIQSQPLAPPPGVTAVEPDPRLGQPQPGQGQTGALPPGQRPRGTPQPANVAPQPGDEVITEAPTVKITNPTAVFAGLDKITGRIISFDVALNETVQFGALQVTPRACYTRPPTETQNIDGFVEVDEVTLQGEIKRLFTGWMFAASPGLHGVEHAIYDVWLTNCKGGTTTVAGPPPTVQQPAPPRSTSPAAATPAQRPARPAQAPPQQQLQPLPPPGVQQRPAPPPPRRDF